MKKLKGVMVSWLVAGCVASGVAGATAACGPLGKTVARTAIDVALAACIAENADLDEGALRDVCKWTDDLAPLVKNLLTSQKAGLKKAAKAGACGPTAADAGAEDAGQ